MVIWNTCISRLAISLVASCLLPMTCWAGDDSAQMRSIVDAAIRPLMADYDVPGMAVAITVNGQTVFFNYGVAARDNNFPVSETTLFELGSVSKTFTVTLGSYAQVLGKLTLHDRPGKYLPQLKGRAIDKASLLNLATYSAGGLPLQFPDEIANDAQLTGYFQNWKPDAAPGVVRRYSNPSIGLFGYVTALALKSDFSDAVETLLFPQLGLHSSYIRVPQSGMPNYAWGYDSDNQPVRVSPGVLDAEAYGVKSSAADMIRFVQANIDPGQLEPSMARAVEATHIGYFKVGEMVQGLGWEQYPYPVSLKRLLAGNSATMIMDPNKARQLKPPQLSSGLTLYNKTGSTNGFGTYVAFVPEQKLGIVMLANKNYPIPARIKAAHAILEQLGAMVK